MSASCFTCSSRLKIRRKACARLSKNARRISRGNDSVTMCSIHCQVRVACPWVVFLIIAFCFSACGKKQPNSAKPLKIQLLEAVKEGDSTAVADLLQQGAPPDTDFVGPQSPLGIAAE